jgi:hypothetical protein
MKITRKAFSVLLMALIAANSFSSFYANMQCRRTSCCCHSNSDIADGAGLAKSCCGCEMTPAVPVPVQPAIISAPNGFEIQKPDMLSIGFAVEPFSAFDFDLTQKIENHAFSPPFNISKLSIPLRC